MHSKLNEKYYLIEKIVLLTFNFLIKNNCATKLDEAPFDNILINEALVFCEKQKSGGGCRWRK